MILEIFVIYLIIITSVLVILILRVISGNAMLEAFVPSFMLAIAFMFVLTYVRAQQIRNTIISNPQLELGMISMIAILVYSVATFWGFKRIKKDDLSFRFFIRPILFSMTFVSALAYERAQQLKNEVILFPQTELLSFSLITLVFFLLGLIWSYEITLNKNSL